MMPYSGLTSDIYAAIDENGQAPLMVATNVNLTRRGDLESRATPQLEAVTVPAQPDFFNFGRRLWVDGDFIYASRLMDEDITAELLYVYIGQAPRILWCAQGGTWVATLDGLHFLAGGEWPPQLTTPLKDKVLSLNVALNQGRVTGYVLTQRGVWQLSSGGELAQADNQNYEIPDDFGAVVGHVVYDALGVERVLFTEISTL